MILVDANLLLYAEDSLSEHHEKARRWWDGHLSGVMPVCLCWPVLKAFVRISTNPRLHQRPLTPEEACDRVQSWFDQPCTRLIQPAENHWPLFRKMVRESNATGNLISDAHLAALTVEHNCTLYSTDSDFARFRGLKWKNPMREG
jgi:toxin-antitoxin system PIN domain toxin